ncbi:hypothetical protein A3E15_00965 [Candidatus Woesebacteria bacterium RIFCSPHIGHO2_12_FULL_42_9]|uniref:Uncharacterized protein n=2 Tax=Candidatus Woeseibacteriota TaxID=1752722 RepID=A0A1F8ARP4_9BACT|nr:MAG: hypothetical protein A2129_00205 [Candidatus Woesebacteria bacterium GWC1_42_13]OGM54434.1 MAG: hypothetical protein A3E15_00965 [Candidatus Woesebacteria bacterium RIFCSPHIGHO2_12_FULL_42_9]
MIIKGFLASLGLLAIYFSLVSLISGIDFAQEQFTRYWYFILTLSAGFGVQVALFTKLKQVARGAHGGVVAVSGTTSTFAMVSCCAHYLANILPVIAVSGFLSLVAQYQIELFWIGIFGNAVGVVYLLIKLKKLSNI